MAQLPVYSHGALVAHALVDDADYELLARLRWCLMRQKGYVCQWSEPDAPRYLHRYILRPPTGLVTDHINGDRLDNRRANLRAIPNADNIRLQPRAKGYHWNPHVRFWYAEVRVRGRRIRQHFRHEADAARFAREIRALSVTAPLRDVRRHAAGFRP